MRRDDEVATSLFRPMPGLTTGLYHHLGTNWLDSSRWTLYGASLAQFTGIGTPVPVHERVRERDQIMMGGYTSCERHSGTGSNVSSLIRKLGRILQEV